MWWPLCHMNTAHMKVGEMFFTKAHSGIRLNGGNLVEIYGGNLNKKLLKTRIGCAH